MKSNTFKVADESAVENKVQKGTIFIRLYCIVDRIGDSYKVHNTHRDVNETKKEVNDGLCGKSAPCCRGPRQRLSRTRHRLVID